ncbi:MAG: hypothetical protein J4203_00955 [Candidatus Diapherotrites archaeon]|uniref:Uncharacterized protein n=1 Tax=Candidatus Iainarchaeum sp. TaxID=3101447 RepID=A0A8T4LGP2_9ARCH|nr:hypothetical protein [Candidatus Diapherotrites archaeon]
MVAYSEEQKRIALLLLHEPKTIEQLNQQLDIPYDALTRQLREMLQLGVVVKEGFPTQYRLKEEIAERAKKRKEIGEEDSNPVRLKITIEAQATERTGVEKALAEMEAALRKEPDFTVYECVLEKLIQTGEHYSSFLEVNLSVKDFRALMRLLFFYGPSSLEVLKPDKWTISADDLQDGLVDAANMVYSYNEYIIRQMTKKELLDFSKKLKGRFR